LQLKLYVLKSNDTFVDILSAAYQYLSVFGLFNDALSDV